MVSFNNIIGHKDIVKHLQNAIKTEKISHSYIFTGRPGSGKKLIATSHVRSVIPVRRHWARIIRIL